MGRKRPTGGRRTADVPDGTVVFLIGMRINKWWKIHRWLPSFLAMPPMLVELRKQPELGMLGYHVWFGRTTLLVEYWKDMDHLMAYARNADHEHVPAWRRFNRRVGVDGSVGVFHEAYVTHPDEMHIIYRNMPEFGMGRFTKTEVQEGSGATTVASPESPHETRQESAQQVRNHE
ncbi:DUF4188 domain-containing protein [Actinopolyspora mortivallis]|uniref:DUF4188 domain-containing protein n=1 Tax=Actinopolyspora mortivallis TaxID=33906 RepID=UPI000A05C916|nr:DUF4188 domain-containing protein [Actinopolyspora mortivallis]